VRVVLDQNTPNPFNPMTTIRYQLDRAADVQLLVFTPSGRLVSRLVNGHVNAGSHEIVWNGTDLSGKPASSGVYYYQLKTEDQTFRNKMVLVR